MPAQLRAKLKVLSVSQYKNDQGQVIQESASLSAVYSSDANSENASFAVATPAASLSMTITNPNALGFFKEGDEVYLDIIPAKPQAEDEPLPFEEGDETP